MTGLEPRRGLTCRAAAGSQKAILSPRFKNSHCHSIGQVQAALAFQHGQAQALLGGERFPNLNFAYEAIEKGGNMPCILNAANEVAVSLFLEDRIGFYEMSSIIEKAMDRSAFMREPTLSDYIQCDKETREIIYSLVN